ncbi:alpha-methylacyl-CoA racemase [Patella vulgata]|uniref:alpha-methylacyl-CoA racemase n=1 Tax=Patella vulgata TaxID=6465 RepID=UPI00217FD09B|nr:alpha-methylacyl-CoA racemase [Patella vulgata]
MALKGIKVIEMAGLAPAPFCGMILSDFGARVIRVDRPKTLMNADRLSRGKQSIAVDLKKHEGREVVRKLCQTADVLLEPFRPGVMEKLGLGPERLMKDNTSLIYARLTGYGQNGCLSHQAGHDINYIATSGVLSSLGRKGSKPHAPINLVADFAGGGMTCALGIMMALFERNTSGLGQVIDTSMVEGSAYISKFLWSTRDMMIWGKEKGDNYLDGGAAFYDTYKTSDDKYMAVGSLEPQFFIQLLKGLNLESEDITQFDDQNEMKKTFTQKFATKTRDEWTEIFEKLDACCTPVLSLDEASSHPHNVENKTFLKSDDGNVEPGPAPKLSRTPAVNKLLPFPVIGQDSVDILKEMGYNENNIDNLIKNNIVEQNMTTKSKL